eukprot:gene15468-18359_t
MYGLKIKRFYFDDKFTILDSAYNGYIGLVGLLFSFFFMVYGGLIYNKIKNAQFQKKTKEKAVRKLTFIITVLSWSFLFAVISLIVIIVLRGVQRPLSAIFAFSVQFFIEIGLILEISSKAISLAPRAAGFNPNEYPQSPVTMPSNLGIDLMPYCSAQATEIIRLQGCVEKQRKEIVRLEAEIERLKTSNTKLEAEIEQLKSSNTRLEAEIGRLKSSNTKLESSNTRLEAEIEQLKSSHARLESSNTSLEAKVKSLDEDRQERHTKLLVGEMARQFEKTVARQLFGERTSLRSLVSVIKRIEDLKKGGDSSKDNEFQGIMTKMDWTLEVEDTLYALKDMRLKDSHPTSKLGGQPVDKSFMVRLIENVCQEEDVLNALKILNYMEKMNGSKIFSLQNKRTLQLCFGNRVVFMIEYQADDEKLLKISFFPAHIIDKSKANTVVNQFTRELEEYFAGKRLDFTVYRVSSKGMESTLLRWLWKDCKL